MRSIAVTLLGLSLLGPLGVHAATQDELEAKLQALSEQVDALKTELAKLKSQQQQQVAATPTPSVTPAAQPATPSVASNLSFFGYGEMSYSRPSDHPSEAVADLNRFVLGVGYRFDDRTRFVSELELEHAVSSAEDSGEIEVEQAYIERQLGQQLFVKAGLFLIPIGLLNENHEPTRYYGVFRNFVETDIIPTTWREGGVTVQGTTEGGLRWDVGISTGFNLAKWDATSSEGQESPLGSIHQELSLARARDLSGFVALNYSGVPGLRVGGTVFGGNVGQGQPGFEDTRLIIWEGHARWTPGRAEISALYSRGHISNTAPVNLTLVGNPTLIPESFFGWYLEGAYRVIDRETWSLAPFVRYERFNTGSEYAFIAQGLTPSALPDQQVFTGGFNWMLAPGVVVKADYQDFRHQRAGDRFNLGLGYQF